MRDVVGVSEELLRAIEELRELLKLAAILGKGFAELARRNSDAAEKHFDQVLDALGSRYDPLAAYFENTAHLLEGGTKQEDGGGG